MPKRSIQRGRPTGTTTYEAKPAIAFGAAVREERTNQGIAQETLAHMAGIERSHMGKIERGEHVLRQVRVAQRLARRDSFGPRAAEGHVRELVLAFHENRSRT